MWWLFELIENEEEYCLYCYARESRTLDGLIRYHKADQSIIVEKACANDADSDFAIRYAKRKFYWIIEEGFPARRLIACG